MLIGVFCSGGDAPGMNACVRAVVRSALSAGHEVVGIRHGYQGLLDEDFFLNAQRQPRMGFRTVSNLIQAGGAILHSSRCKAFHEEAGQKKAAELLRRHGIEGLVAIGGDGTFRGAMELARHWDGRIIGCPGTIDNDLQGTDFTIGFHTAVQTAVEAVDKLRDTAESHERLFLVEVMGRHSGYIALHTALAAAAEVAALPETMTDVPRIVEQIMELKRRGKSSVMVIVAEGDETGGAANLQRSLDEAGCAYDTRVVILGHIQRGGTPAPGDRLLASRLGDFAVRSILDGHTGAMAGEIDGELTLTPFPEVCQHNPVPDELLKLLQTLSQ